MSYRPIHVYKASAGSGKTFALSAEFIANLIKGYEVGEHPHRHQLAITFTKKATTEMKERILQSLYELWQGKDTSDGFFQAVRGQVPTELPDAALRSRAGQALKDIVHNYEQFHVTTIDSFFQRLLTSLAHELGLTSSFKVDLGDGNILSKGVERMMQQLEPGSEVLEWITQFVAEQLDEGKSWNVAKQLKKLSEELLKEPYLKYGDLLRALPLNNVTVGLYRRDIKGLKEEQKKFQAKRAEELKDFIEQTEGFGRISRGNNLATRLDKYIASILPDVPSDTLREQMENPIKILKTADVKKRPDLLPWAQEVSQRLNALERSHSDIVMTVNSCDLSLKHLNALRLLDDIDAHVRQVNSDNNAFMLAHTPLLFAHLVSGSEAPFVFERAGTQYRHVMIDEFQDTSTLQWLNLQHLLVENIAQGNSCMLVGDVKQSIYRWRGGDWTALSQMQDGPSIETRTLDANYRSGRTIVEFNNSLFVQLAQQLAVLDPQKEEELSELRPTIADIYTPAEVEQRPHHQGGFVRMCLIQSTKKKADDSEGELDKRVEIELAEQILRLHAEGVPYEKMAILVRRNDEVKHIFDYFDQAKHLRQIPLVSDEAFLLSSSPAVQTIVHALRYILNKSDGVARAYIEAHAPEGKAESLCQLLEKWHVQGFHSMPFYDLITRLIHCFELHTLVGQSPYLYAFLDCVLAFTEENAPDLRTFLTEWEERLYKRSIPSTVVKGVRLLTIHKSKGLAFHSVFVPYCNWTIEKDNVRDLLWVNPQLSPYNGMPLLPITCTKKAGESIYQADYEEEHRNRRIENLNLLYVAFTRARQNLVICARQVERDFTIYDLLHKALKDGEGSLHLAMEQKGYKLTMYKQIEEEQIVEWGQPSTRECVSTKAEKAPTKSNPLIIEPKPEVLNFDLHASRAVFRQSNKARALLASMDEEHAAQTFDLSQYQARRIGQVLHTMMEHIEQLDDVDRVVQQTRLEGQLADSLPADEVVRLLHRALAHPIAKEWFDGSWRLYRESTLLQRNSDGSLLQQRPDRVMVRGDEVVVVDYKFGKPRPIYHDQVRGYCRILSQMGHCKVRGYLWYVYTGDVVPVEM